MIGHTRYEAELRESQVGKRMKKRKTMRAREDEKNLLLALAIGTVIRSIPNVVTPYPIGYDTIYYTTQILDWRNCISDPNIVFKTPLHILILGPIYATTGLDPFVILRIIQPLLYGLLATSFYYAARNVYKWETRQALLATIIFSLQTTTLRISWDLLRNELSLAILLFTLPKLKNHERESWAFTILSILVVLSHQLTSAILFFIITFFFVNHIRKKEYNQAQKLLLASSPSALLFTCMLAYNMGIIGFPTAQIPSIFPTIISIPIKRSLPFPFSNYLAGEGFVDYNHSYLFLLTDVVSLHVASYLLILPFVIVGFRDLREETMDLWTGFCAFGSLMCLVAPQYSLLLWDRWMQLLVVPYTSYATEGIIKLSNKRILKRSRSNLPFIACTIYAIIAVLYMTTPYTNPVSLYAAVWPSSKYSPPTMQRNTSPVEDTPDIERAFRWLNNNMEKSSCLLTREAFLDWAKIYLKKDGTIVSYQNKFVSEGLQYAKALNYSTIYWIWWDNGIGLKWYGQPIPEEFKPIYKTGNIVIYKYTYR